LELRCASVGIEEGECGLRTSGWLEVKGSFIKGKVESPAAGNDFLDGRNPRGKGLFGSFIRYCFCKQFNLIEVPLFLIGSEI